MTQKGTSNSGFLTSPIHYYKHGKKWLPDTKDGICSLTLKPVKLYKLICGLKSVELCYSQLP